MPVPVPADKRFRRAHVKPSRKRSGVWSRRLRGAAAVLVVGLVAWVLFKERPPKPVLAAVPIVLAGVVLIYGVVGSGAYGANPPLGVLLGTITALSYAGYLLVIRRGSSDLRRPPRSGWH